MKATPDDYKIAFQDTKAGELVLEDLLARFAKKVFVKGGHEGDRETCYRAGMRDVVEHIVTMINRANGVQDDSENEEAAAQ